MIESTIEATKNEEFVLKSPEKEFERPIKHDVSRALLISDSRANKFHYFQVRENDNKEEAMNGRTAINIPGDLPSPKAKSPPAVVEKRREQRHEQQKEHRDHHRDHHNGAKVSNHHNNNHKSNSACLNNLILPLITDVSDNGEQRRRI